MDRQLDDLSKSLAEGVSRREALRKFLSRMAIIAVLAAVTSSAILAQNYAITTLQEYPNGINQTGQVIGLGVLWTPAVPNGTTGSFTALPPLPGKSSVNYYSIASWASGLNSSGDVVGAAIFYTTKDKLKSPQSQYIQSRTATFWHNGMPMALSTPAGTDSVAYSINDSGDIVGVTNNVAALWHNGSLTKLATPAKCTSVARGINNAGQIVGYTQTGTYQSPNGSVYGRGYATLWQVGKAYNLGGLSGYTQGSTANGISAAGQIVGKSWTFVNGIEVDHAFIWTPTTPSGISGNIADLGILSLFGIDSSTATSCNVSCQVVGTCYSNYYAYGATVPFLWDSIGGMRNLNDLLPSGSPWYLYTARAINDTGQIIGTGSPTGDGTGGTGPGYLLTLP